MRRQTQHRRAPRKTGTRTRASSLLGLARAREFRTYGQHLASRGSYEVKDRFSYRVDPFGPALCFPLPVPGTATPIECGESAGIEAVIVDNGDVGLWDGGNVRWRSGGSFPQ